MNPRITLLCSAGIFALAAAPTFASEGTEWGYSGDTGPENWGTLDPAFSACGTGVNQSPVDLASFVDGELPALELDYSAGSAEIVNNGHSIQVNYPAGSTLTVDGISFSLQQFHFHTPSENRLAGRSFPIEAHFVHADAAGNLAVLAVMFEQRATNIALDSLWKFMPRNAGGKAALPGSTDASSLLPPSLDYFRYNGSLTTPPCSEGVRWLVLKTPVSVSSVQAEKLAEVLGHSNNRPTQPLNARIILE